MSKENRSVTVKFGILNIGGYMPSRPIEGKSFHSEVIHPLFVGVGYKIKTTFNRNINYVLDGEKHSTSDFGAVFYNSESQYENGVYYQKNFRRDVLWNFGDGTEIEGANVEHYYKKPGRYKITCTFFDINRKGWTNTYSLYVQVKEIVPTSLRFSENEENFKSEIKCSKIEKILKLEALVSPDLENINLISKRVIETTEDKAQKSYTDLKSVARYHMRPYYTFLKNEKIYFYKNEEIHSSYMRPVENYDVDYHEIYGKFQYDILTEKIALKLFLYYPFKLKDEDHLTYKCIDPNCDITKNDDYINISLKQIFSLDEEEDIFFVGKRGFVEIYYKNDNLSKKNSDGTYVKDNHFTFFFDLEEKNIYNDIKSSKNYLNMIPLGYSVAIVPNSLNDVKISMSLNGFLRDIDSSKNIHIDEYFYNALTKNFIIDAYIAPYILYENEGEIIEELGYEISNNEISDFKTDDKSYYIPKDIILSDLTVSYRNDNNTGNQSAINTVDDVYKSDTFVRCEITPRDFINHSYSIKIKNKSEDATIIETFDLRKDNIVDSSKITIPTEKYTPVDVKKLVDVYMIHPMFDEAYKLKDSLISLFKNKDFLSYILTKSNNFLDDRMNIKTCYLSNLLATLKMMGEEITDYETTEFEGINEMRDFVRILSMNHNDLVGHLVDKPCEIYISKSSMGRNVGKALGLKDRLYLSTHTTTTGYDLKGLVTGYKKYDKETYGPYKKASDNYGCHLILHDKYTDETRIVSFTTIEKLNSILKEDENGKKYVCLADYDESWGWNLLLTDRFKLAKNELNTSKNLTSMRRKRLEEVCHNVIDGYYDFYTLVTNNEKERIGNFLNENTIIESVEDVELWNEKWGYVNDILLKIIIENGKLKRDVDEIPENEIVSPLYPSKNLFIKKTVSESSDINVKLTLNGSDEHTLYLVKDASIEFNSYGGAIKNTMNVYIKNFVVRDYTNEYFTNTFSFKDGDKYRFTYNLKDNIFGLNGEGVIENNIDMYNNDYDESFGSNMSIEINGDFNNPIIRVDINLDVPFK